MKAKAILEARDRLERARKAVAILSEGNSTFLDLKETWWSFVLAADRVYSKLEQGAKGDGPSAGWYGRAKHTRKTDELLSYIHHARISEEQGLGGSSEETVGDFVVTKGGRAGHDEATDQTTIYLTASVPFEGKFVNDGIRLIKVTDDRYGDTFSPPTSHNGRQLDDRLPKTVATLGLSYLEDLIAEAEKLPVHQ